MKKTSKLMIMLGSVSSIIVLPLVAAACNNTNIEPAPSPDEQKLKKEITFKYTGTINDNGSNFDLDKINLDKNNGFEIDKNNSEVKIKIEAKSSVIPFFKKYAIAKLTLKKGNTSYEFYVKFEIEKTNPMGDKVSKEEFNEAKKQQKEIKEQELKNKIVFKYDGKISEDAKDFDLKNIKLEQNDDFQIVSNSLIVKKQIKLEGAITKINKKYAALKLDIKKGNTQIPFYLAFKTNVENPIGYVITKEEFEKITDNIDASSLKFKYNKLEDLKNFNLSNIEIIGDQTKDLKIEKETALYNPFKDQNYLLIRITLENSFHQKSQYIYLKIYNNKRDIEITDSNTFNEEFSQLAKTELMEKISELYKDNQPEKEKLEKMVNQTSNIDELLVIVDNIKVVETKSYFFKLIEILKTKNPGKYQEFFNIIKNLKSNNDLAPITSFYKSEVKRVEELINSLKDDKTKTTYKNELKSIQSFDSLYKLENKIKSQSNS
ncbi:hypothetical protein DA803_01725 [[Mycoplasma] phocae]|uniref:Lipoprotein n=1 Tax=[Mycoplasma] phocae TaxID=142651 RepID=A0A2Z5IPW7_9BACT|nr:variable surface lipoprotein [[Mycoplasma] phocae]AXE60803.1 hypothetical protein DA803_01725 [[Mycoplasma] phocae]